MVHLLSRQYTMTREKIISHVIVLLTEDRKKVLFMFPFEFPIAFWSVGAREKRELNLP